VSVRGKGLPIILYVYSSLEEEIFILRIDPFSSLPFRVLSGY